MRLSIVFIFAVLILYGPLRAQEIPFISDNESSVFLRAPFSSYADRPVAKSRKPSLRPLAFGVGHFSEFTNVNITDTTYGFDQDEPAIALDPNNPHHLVAGANDFRSSDALWAYASIDDGASWHSGEVHGTTTLNFATDPSFAFLPNGKVLFAYGRYGVANPPLFGRNDVVVFSSTDGKIWDDGKQVFSDTKKIDRADTLSDKFYIATDQSNSSPYKGRAYVTWVDQGGPQTSIVCSYSTDGGNTWSHRTHLTPANSFWQAPVPICGSNGDLYVVYENLSDSLIVISRSTNGGLTFEPGVTLSKYLNLGPIHPIGNPRGFPVIKGEIGVNSFASLAVDTLKYPGRIYVTWCGKATDGTSHVFLSQSNDRAQTWSIPKIVDDDHTAIATDKFFSWVAVDPSTGDVGVAFYDRRLDQQADSLADLFLSISTDGGSSFTSRVISSASFDPTRSNEDLRLGSIVFFGDYITVAVRDRRWHPVWTDSRSGYEQDIYTSDVHPYAPSAIQNGRASKENNFARIAWDYNGLTTFGWPLHEYKFIVHRKDGKFDTVLSRNQLSFLDTSILPGSIFHYNVSVVSGGDTSRVVVIDYSPKESVQNALQNREKIIQDVRVLNNPGRAGFPIRISVSLTRAVTSSLAIFDELGRTVTTQVSHGGESLLEASGLTSGTYYYRLTVQDSESAEAATGRFVVLDR